MDNVTKEQEKNELLQLIDEKDREPKKGRGRPKKDTAGAEIPAAEKTIAGLSAAEKKDMLKEIAALTCHVLNSVKFGNWDGWNNDQDNEIFASGFLPVTEKYFPSFFDLGGIPEFAALAAAFTIYQSKKSQYFEAKKHEKQS